jgi:DnaJ-class molecular chaperone
MFPGVEVLEIFRLEREWYSAQDTKESEQHIPQQPQPAKCPSCFGAGREYNGPYGYTNRPCLDCDGTGIRQVGA